MPYLTPRQNWLINRVIECCKSLEPFNDKTTWEEYMIQAKEFAEELLYACTEWEKYYKDSENK